jgi:hypothetical protein
MEDIQSRLDEIEKQASSAKYLIDFVQLVENHFAKLLEWCRALGRENEALKAEKKDLERQRREGAPFLEVAPLKEAAFPGPRIARLEAVANAARKQGHSASNHRYTPDFLWDNCVICDALYALDSEEPERPRSRVFADRKPPGGPPRPRGGV